MPLYEYHCSSCGRTTEALQSFSDDPLTVCEACGGELKKLLSSPAFQFKGSGWYVSDYGKGSTPGTEKPKEGAAEGGKAEGGGSDSKTSEKSGEGSSDRSSEKSSDKGSDAKPSGQSSDKPSSGGESSAPKDGGKSSG
jgi:putative FmdB family regulatory protein